MRRLELSPDLARREQRRMDVDVRRARADGPHQLLELSGVDALCRLRQHLGGRYRSPYGTPVGILRTNGRDGGNGGGSRGPGGLAQPDDDAADRGRLPEMDVRLRDGAFQARV